VSQHCVLHLERGSCRAARDDADQPAHDQVHEEEDHAAPILRVPTKAQISVSDPYRVMKGIVAVAVTVALSSFAPSVASADPPQPLGGLHLLEYCQAHGWDTVIFPRGQLNDAFTWVCYSVGRS
jgi:hypothetical protein